MPQHEHMEMHKKRHGVRMDAAERKRKKEAREVHRRSQFAQKVHGLRAKLYNQKRFKEKAAMKKTLALHQERTNKHGNDENIPDGAVPSYLLDREGVSRAKVLSNTVKQKRKEKAGKWDVPIPKVKHGAWGESKEAAPASMDSAWQDAKTAEEKTMEGVWQDTNDLEAMWEKAMADAQLTDPFEDVWDGVNGTNEYVYKADNPFSEQTENFERGVQFFESGHLDDAILAFEAEVKQHPENSEAWRMLGECHAENDEDKSAIICLERAVEEDPYNLSALLALGVSHVNELNSQGALKTLKAWVQHNPKFHGLEIHLDEYSDGSLMDEVMQLMLQARAHDPSDSDVQVVLGVLYNVSKDYDAAVSSFRGAADVRPSEYTLWNKLGATLANSSRSADAIPAYHKALELKPRYARGWLNLGISHANLGDYQEAVKCYLQALSLNARADHIWSYLRICFTCMERFDLVKLADTRDVSVFRDEFKLLDF